MAGERFNYLLHYARRGSPVWIAHLDLMRAFERAVLRAGLPVVWSGGFNPRPALEFALPVGVGIETRREPFVLGLGEPLPADELRSRLSRVMPPGLDIVAAAAYEPQARSLMARVVRADYEIRLAGIGRYRDLLCGDAALTIEKRGKKGTRTLQVRDGLLAVDLPSDDTLFVSLAAGSQNNIRPDLLLAALARAAGEPDAIWHDADIIRRGVVLN